MYDISLHVDVFTDLLGADICQEDKDLVAQVLVDTYPDLDCQLKKAAAMRMIQNLGSADLIRRALPVVKEDNLIFGIMFFKSTMQSFDPAERLEIIAGIFDTAVNTGCHFGLSMIMDFYPEAERQALLEPVPLLWWMKGYKFTAYIFSMNRDLVSDSSAMSIIGMADDYCPSWAEHLREKRKWAWPQQ